MHTSAPSSPSSLAPPVARRIPKAVKHGRIDEYAWLRDRNDPETIAYLEAENRYTEALMQPMAAVEEKLYQEILGRVKETDVSVPVARGQWLYYTRTERGKQYPIHCRKRGGAAGERLDGAEEILLDGNQLAEGHDYFSLGAFEPSPDHNLLAYAVDLAGDEVYTGRFVDLRTRELLPDAVTGASAPLGWANDNRTCFYVTLDEAKRPYRLFRHRLGAREDELLYQEDDERFEMEVLRARSGAYVFVEIASNVTSEYRYLPADDPGGQFRVLLARRQDVEYDVAHHGGHFYVRINDHGRNFRLLRTDLDGAAAVEVRPHREEVLLEGVETFRDQLVLVEREAGLRQIAIENLSTGERHRVEFPEPVYTAWPMDNLEFHTTRLRLGYTSLVTPLSVFDYDMGTRERELRKRAEVLGGYDAAQYASERIFADAPDGARVPISLVYRKGLARGGEAPALVYGYGAYGAASEPRFSSDRLSLVDRGFVYAIAHVRGGEEMGRGWYEDGRLLRKRNTFTDFIACAERLVAGGYTSRDRLAIGGGSAGGLLIGAALNMRPDLFHAAVAKAPFVDALNTMLDPTLPLTAIEYEEWGNPEDPAYYDYILSYSPYDNVEAKTYPHLLITAGLNDPRVGFWEPAKWAARLRARKTGDRLLLLKTNMGAGHFGPSGRYRKFRETAFEYAFLAKVGLLEMDKKTDGLE
ncbi:MAG: S9 family peptidase [Bryobacteraceae bacterium]